MLSGKLDFRIWGEVWFEDMSLRILRIKADEVTKRMEKREGQEQPNTGTYVRALAIWVLEEKQESR